MRWNVRVWLMAVAGFAFGMPSPSHAQTTVCGALSSNSEWRAEASPFVVTCSVVVPKGLSLTIGHGVEVRFKRRVFLKVEGALLVQGSEANPVLFTSSSDAPHPGDWGGVTFTGSNQEGRSMAGSLVRYALFQFAGSSGRTGVLEVEGAGPYLEHVVIQKSTASAISINKGTMQIRNGTFMQNSNSQAFGGGILAFSSTLVVEGSAIGENPASGSGGGIHAVDSLITLRHCSVSKNETSGNGGGLFATDSTVSIEGCVFRDNGTALRGGAVYAARSKVTVSNSVFRQNKTVKAATFGAPAEAGMLVQGAAIYATDSTMTITDSTFLGNQATSDCAALSAARSLLVVRSTTFTENLAVGDGAALCLDQLAEGSSITGSTIARNTSEKLTAPSIIYLRAGLFPAFVRNNISGNIGYDLLNGTTEPIQAGQNWWGTADEETIRGRILDRSQDAAKGEVVISPVLSAPIPRRVKLVPSLETETK